MARPLWQVVVEESRSVLDPREVLLIVVRWSHAAAAVVLVGGSAFYLLVLAPSLARSGPAEPVQKRADGSFKELLDLSAFVLLVSGGLLVFERLSGGAASTLYVVVLGIKVVLSLLVYRLAHLVRRGRGWHSREAKLMVGAGFLVVFLATVLKTLYEAGLRAA